MRLHLPNQDYRVIINLVGKVDKARTQFRASVPTDVGRRPRYPRGDAIIGSRGPCFHFNLFPIGSLSEPQMAMREERGGGEERHSKILSLDELSSYGSCSQ